ncbi:MAG: hypothetical protein AAB358_03610 [Patescibacteria group bacterium]
MSTARSARIPIAIYLKVQQEEVDSPLNVQGAIEEFGHNPDRSEKWLHYIHCGRAEEFAAIHSDEHIYFTGLAADCDPMALSEEQREALLLATWEMWRDLFARYSWLRERLSGEGSMI